LAGKLIISFQQGVKLSDKQTSWLLYQSYEKINALYQKLFAQDS